MGEDNNPKVVYDVGDLLDRMGTRIDQGFATITAKLDNKADKSDLAAINARLDEHGREIGRLKDRQREDEAAQKALEGAQTRRASMRQWSVSTWVAIAGVASSAGFLVYTVIH